MAKKKKKTMKKTAKKATKKMKKPAKKMMAKKVKGGKKVKAKKATPKKTAAKKATPKKEKTMGMGAAAMAGGMAGAATAYGTSAEESMDFEGMSETMAGDDDMDSVEDEPFAETEVENFDDDDTEMDDEGEGDDDEGYF